MQTLLLKTFSKTRGETVFKRLISIILTILTVGVFTSTVSFAAPVDLNSGYSVLFTDDWYAYTGNEIKPEVIVVNDEFWCDMDDYYRTYENYMSDDWDDSWREKYTLSPENYSVVYPDDCISAGNKSLTVVGKGDCSGSLNADYYISRKELHFTRIKNADRSVSLKADLPVDLTDADVWFFNEDYHLKNGEYTIAGDTVTIASDFLDKYESLVLNHRIQIHNGTYFGDATVRSYNISGLAGLGNIKKVYNGKQKTLTNLDLGINDADLGTEFKIVYGQASRKSVGRYTYTLKGKGDYRGSLRGSFEIIPKKPAKITYARKSGTKAYVRWKKVANCSGYQVQLIRYSNDDSDMRSYVVYKNVFVKGRNSLSKTFRNVSRSKYTKVRVRAYKLVKGKKYYSFWKYRKL